MIKRLAVFLVIVTTLAGCGHPLIPVSVLSSPSQQAVSATAASADVELSPNAIGANGPVLGVNLYSLSNYSSARVRKDGERTLSYIRNVLHAGAVDIVWNFYTPSFFSDNVNVTSATLSASNVAVLTGIAQKDGLLVEYRPLIIIGNDHPWEGSIVPVGLARWFNNYYKRELPYLHIAQRYHISEFVAGTELKGINDSLYWPAFFERLGKVYHGVVSYAAHQADYFPPNMQLLPLKYIGVDMYRILNLPASASTAEVTAAYESFFSRIPTSVLRRTAIDETGIEARAGAYHEPSFLFIRGRRDEAVQANWFIAACNTVKKYDMRAVFFWKVDLTDNPVIHPASSLSTFEGKEGARAIAQCANILNG